MKMKTFSKIMAIALTAVMTTCMTSCEDQRDIPVYGTGLESEVGTSVRYNLSPTAPVETEPAEPVEAYIHSANVGYSDLIGEYIAVTIVVTNNTGETYEVGNLIGVSVVDDSGNRLVLGTNNPPELDDAGIRKEVNNDEQMFAICTFSNPFSNYSLDGINFIDISIQSGYVEGTLDSRRFYLTEE